MSLSLGLGAQVDAGRRGRRARGGRPVALTAPSLLGTGRIGTPVTVDPGAWRGADRLRLQWRRNGHALPDAAGNAFLPTAADDRSEISCAVTAENAAGTAVAVTAGLTILEIPPLALGALADLILTPNSGVHDVDASSDFTGNALRFGVTGEGVAIDPATGALSIDTDRLLAGVTVIVTATNSGGAVTSRFRLTVAAADIAPACLLAPGLAGSGEPGAPVSVDPGRWSGSPAPELALQWLIDGAEIPGATEAVYVPQAADDTRALACRVTATNAAGTAEAVSPAIAVLRSAPVAVGGLADLVVDAGTGPVTVAAAAAFAGDGLTFAVSGAAATIDTATGRVTLATDVLLDRAQITVTASNSGGSAASGFLASVRATLPVSIAAPALAGSGRIGAPVTVDPGTWGGAPAPELALQWLIDGAEIPGATEAVHVPQAADDTRGLACRVTATNPAGSATALSAARAVTQTPPAVVAALPDVTADLGAAPLAVAAAAAFAGAGLRFAVAGAGATIDAATGRIAIPATAELAAVAVTVTATNSGGAAEARFRVTVKKPAPVPVPPVMVAAPVLAGTAKIGQALTVTPGSWSGVPSPALAPQWLRGGGAIAGATGTSYTLAPADDLAAISCRMTATNAAGSAAAATAALTATYVAPVARGGLLAKTFDAGTGPQTVAAAADFTGENLRFTVAGAGATIDPARGIVSIPTDTPVSALVTVTATNSGGSAASAFQATVKSADLDIPVALAAADVTLLRTVWRPSTQATWFTPVLRFPGLDGQTVDAIQWTTSVKAVIPDTEYETVVPIGASTYQILMKDPAKNQPGVAPRVDYSVFRTSELGRRSLRFRWRKHPDGPWSEASTAHAVPEPAMNWVPLLMRNKAQFELGQAGGAGMQFLRSFGNSPARPNFLIGAMDANMPWASDDFGQSFYTPRWEGMWAGSSGIGAWVDPEDADRQLLMYAANDTQTYSGIYLSTDAGLTATRSSSVLMSGGKDVGFVELQTAAAQRKNTEMLAHKPGGTPATRTLYGVEQVSVGGTDITRIQLWKSVNGGTSFTPRGPTLPVATYASGEDGIYGVAVAPNGDLYIWGKLGAWRSTDDGNAWTKLAALPAGKEVFRIEVRGAVGEVWAAVKDNGLYKSTNSGAAFTRNAALGTYDIRHFALSPADRGYICVCGDGETPRYSHDGGATWAKIVSNPFPGQENSFGNQITKEASQFIPHALDRNLWFAHRFQHMGASKDGGVTFDFAGKYYDGVHTRGMGFDPKDWTRFAMVQQDRTACVTYTGGDYVVGDLVEKDNVYGQQIIAANGMPQHLTGRAILMRSSGRVIVALGHIVAGKVPVIMDPTPDHPLGTTLVRDEAALSWADQAWIDPNDANAAYMGRWYLTNLDAASQADVAIAARDYECIGVSDDAGTTASYWIAKGNDKVIYRSTRNGTSPTPWLTASESFRLLDGYPVAAVCPHHPQRIYLLAPNGRLRKVEKNGDTFTQTLVFDAAAFIAAHPNLQLASVVIDPRDPGLIHVSLADDGVPNVFRTVDGGATWTDISANLPLCDGRLFVNPLTSEVFFGSNHATWILQPPAGFAAARGIQNSLYARVRAYLDNAK